MSRAPKDRVGLFTHRIVALATGVRFASPDRFSDVGAVSPSPLTLIVDRSLVY